MGRLRDFESVVAFLSEEEIDEMQAAIDARRGARTGGGTLEAHEALSGTAVRVGEGARGSELAGMVGVHRARLRQPRAPRAGRQARGRQAGAVLLPSAGEGRRGGAGVEAFFSELRA